MAHSEHGAERAYGVVPAGARPGFTRATVSARRVSLGQLYCCPSFKSLYQKHSGDGHPFISAVPRRQEFPIQH